MSSDIVRAGVKGSFLCVRGEKKGTLREVSRKKPKKRSPWAKKRRDVFLCLDVTADVFRRKKEKEREEEGGENIDERKGVYLPADRTQ